MKFTVSPKIFEKFAELRLGVLIVKGIDNTGENQEILDLIKDREKDIRQNYQKDKLSEDLKIDCWRKAYSSFGAKPKKYKCSVENLYRMILDGIDLKHINKLVDIYNYISIRYMIPVGGDDIDKVAGSILLKYAAGDENFKELNSDEVTHPKEGEIVYADDDEVLCRRWNWRECDKTKMTEETKNAIIVIEAVPVFSKQEVEEILNELAALVQKFCGGEVEKFIVDKENNELEIVV